MIRSSDNNPVSLKKNDKGFVMEIIIKSTVKFTKEARAFKHHPSSCYS